MQNRVILTPILLLDNYIFYFSTICDALAVVTNGHELLLFSLCINLILHSLMVGATRMHDCTVHTLL